MAQLTYPFDELTAYREHYRYWLKLGDASDAALDQLAAEYTFGGLPLEALYSNIHLEPSNGDPLSGDIQLTPSKSFGGRKLTIQNVSLRQFLTSGLPKPEWYNKWIGPDGIWKDKKAGYGHLFKDAQYRLELAHSETWRWSIFFKRAGLAIGGAQIVGGERLSDIELVNNCTTTEGFEFRVRMNGRLYHSSIADPDGDFGRAYTLLSQRQAGSLPDQEGNLAAGDEAYSKSTRRFGFKTDTIYGHSLGWGPVNDVHLDHGPLTPGITVRIDLSKYRKLATGKPGPISLGKPNIDRRRIDFARFGSSSPYYEKPLIRKLFCGYKKYAKNETTRRRLPTTYRQIASYEELQLSQFWPSGIYDPQNSVPVRAQKWLYEIDSVNIHPIDRGHKIQRLYELELRRSHKPDEFQLRRIVLGNLDLRSILLSEEPYTIHRFGYGARPTTMDYDPTWRPPTDPANPAHYAFLLAGPDRPKKKKAEDPANYFICPESFGVERAILTGDREKRTLTIDLVSFERILFLWRATFKLPDSI